MPTEYLECGMSIWTQKQKIVVSGNTYAHRSLLREIGGEWNGETKNWIFKIGTDFMKLRALNPTWCCCQKAVITNKKNHMFNCAEHYPNGYKPAWFCGHEGAEIYRFSNKSWSCEKCSPCKHTGGFLVGGFTYTGD